MTKQLVPARYPILIARSLNAAGVGEVIDFMPVAGHRATDRHRLVRTVRVVRGPCVFTSRASPGSTTAVATEVEVSADGAVFRSNTFTMNVPTSHGEDRIARPEDSRRTSAAGSSPSPDLRTRDSPPL